MTTIFFNESIIMNGQIIYPTEFNNLNNVLIRALFDITAKNRDIYYKSSHFYSVLHYFLLGMNILVLSISEICAFLAMTATIDDDKKYQYLIIVGILNIIAITLITLSSKLLFKTRAEFFQRAAISFEKLNLQVTKYLYYIPLPNYIEQTNARIISIKNKAKYLPPWFF